MSPALDHPAGPLLRAARERAGLSQRRLGRLMGCDQARVSRVESGAEPPSPSWLARAAAALGADPAALGVCYRDSIVDAPGIASPPPPDPSGRVITLEIDRDGGRDNPLRLAPRAAADAAVLCELGVPSRLDTTGPDFARLLVLASNRRVDVLVRYDRPPVVWRPKPKPKAEPNPRTLR